MKASTTALLTGHIESAEQQRGYIALMDEETDRLNSLVSDAIQMARLEAGHVQLRLEKVDIADATRRVLDRMRTVCDDHPVQMGVPDTLPKVPPIHRWSN